MTKHIYRYRFSRTVPVRDIEATLMLALIAVESLYGRARLRMDGRYRLDREQRLCEIDASTRVGCDLAEIFTGYVTHEYGDDAVVIRREVIPAGVLVDSKSAPAGAAAGAAA